MFVVTSALKIISIICIIIKKANYNIQHENEAKFNNAIKNKALMSPGQYVFVGCIFLLSLAPTIFISEDLLLSYPWLGTFKETVFQFGTYIMGPILFFIFNKNARKYVKVLFWDSAPDWLYRFNPDRVEQIELNQVNPSPDQ